MKRFVWWILIFVLLATGLTLYVIGNNGSENDYNFVIETLGIGFCVNIIASIVIMVFFENRDRKIRYTHERSAARRIALVIERYLATEPRPAVAELRNKLELITDTLHLELNEEVKRDIAHFLHTTEYAAADAEPDHTVLKEIEEIRRALKRHYGAEIFATVRHAK